MAFGDTYPNRFGAPQSSVVGYQPNPDEWGADYQTRYNAAAGKPKAPSIHDLLWKQVNDYGTDAAVTDPGQLQNAFDFAWDAYRQPHGSPLSTDAVKPPSDTQMGAIPDNTEFATSMFGNDFYPTLERGRFNINHPGTKFQDPGVLNALASEKASMLPGEEIAKKAQQSYGMITGQGQTNGVMSADYSSPDFGRITGNFGQDNLGKLGATLTPQMAPGTAPSTIWGAAPRRVREWGI